MRRLMNIAPPRFNALLLGLASLAAILMIYVSASIARLAANPDRQLPPSFAAMGDVVTRYALHADPRTGEVLLWSDTLASLERLALGLGLATIIGLAWGIALGVVPLVRAAFGIVVAIIAVVPPMAILPILFIVFDPGRNVEGRADRDRRDAVSHSRPGASRACCCRSSRTSRRKPSKPASGNTSSASPCRNCCRCDYRRRALVAWAGLAVPHRRRSDCVGKRSRLPHLLRATLSRDGRHPALRRVDHLDRLRERSGACCAFAQSVPLGPSQGGADDQDPCPRRL